MAVSCPWKGLSALRGGVLLAWRVLTLASLLGLAWGHYKLYGALSRMLYVLNGGCQ